MRELTRRGHGVTAVVRNKKTLADLGLNKVKQLEGTILDSFTDEQVQDMVSDADAVLICLGHVLSFSGIFFHPGASSSTRSRRSRAPWMEGEGES